MNNIIDIRRLLRAIKQLKWLYLAAFLFFGGIAGWLIYRSIPLTPVQGEMLVGEAGMDSASGASAIAAAKAGGVGSLMKTFSIGGLGQSAIDNETYIVASHDVMLRAVRNLGLNRQYIGVTSDNKKNLLYGDSPVLVEAPAELFDTLSIGFRVRINPNKDGSVNVRFEKGLLKKKIVEKKGVQLPASIETPYGVFQLISAGGFAESPYKSLQVMVSGNDAAAELLQKQINLTAPSKLSDILMVSLNYGNPELGKAIVNGIMAEYNAKRLDRVHQNALNSISYYDKRLAETLTQLQSAEKNVAEYQRDNALVSPASELPMLASQNFQQRTAATMAQGQLDYYTSVVKSLQGNLDGLEMLPTIESVGDGNIASYNELVAKRKELEQSAKPGNPTLQRLQERQAMFRDLIIESAENAIEKAKAEIRLQQSMAGGAKAQLNTFAGKAMTYAGLERNMEFQNSLYLFLVQERENAVLKLYTDTDLSYVYQPAYVTKAGLPLKSIAMFLIAVLFGMLCVTCLTIILMWYSQRIKAPMDIAFMHIDTKAINSSANGAMAKMRTMILESPDTKILYVADFANNGDSADKLQKSFDAAEIKVANYAAPTNDLLLSPESAKTITKLESEGKYVFVKIPNPTEVYMLETCIDAPQAALLIVVPTTMRRKSLKNYLKGQTASKIFTIIDD